MLRLLALASIVLALAACREERAEAPDAGARLRPIWLAEHTIKTAERMADERFHAELLAELAAAYAASSTAASPLVEATLAQALEIAKQVPRVEERELAVGKIAAVAASYG